MDRPRIAVIVRYGLNPNAWEERHRRGEVADRTPYGYHLAESAFDLEWSTDRIEGATARWWRMTAKRVLGFDFIHVWRNRDAIARADAVWTHTEREHLAVLATMPSRPVGRISPVRPKTGHVHSARLARVSLLFPSFFRPRFWHALFPAFLTFWATLRLPFGSSWPF